MKLALSTIAKSIISLVALLVAGVLAYFGGDYGWFLGFSALAFLLPAMKGRI